MRVFLAIDVPAVLHDPLLSLQRQAAHPAVKLTEHFHLTLTFFGDVGPADMMIIQQQLARISCPAFTLTSGVSLGAFSNWNRLRTIFLPLEYNKTLNQLAIKLQNLFPELESSRKGFEAHITLGRVKQELHDGGAYATHLQSLQLDAPISWRVPELVLYESILRPEGPTYRVLSKVRLS